MLERLTLSAGVAGLILVATLTTAVRPADASELRKTPIVTAVERVAPSVVNIRGEKSVPQPTPGAAVEAARRVNGMGTGVIIDPRGYILTNYHVVDGVHDIQVTLADEQHYSATLVARDAETDLAIIKMSADEPLPVVPLGTSSDLMKGETVIAVGNAYGYEHTVTRGIISALHRPVQVSDAQFYDDLIQTDASINPGNSGGPLLNIDGDMIGINVAVRAGAQGIGFAIPVDKALNVAAKMLGTTAAEQVWHGVEPGPDHPLNEHGMTVGHVEPKSPAETCGLEAGDVVTKIDGQTVRRGLDFERAMLDRKPGDKLEVTVEREGKPLDIDLVLGNTPAAEQVADAPTWDVLGLKLNPLDPDEFRTHYQTRYRGGLSVVEVRPNSPAAAQGIRPGDVLVGMHIWETISEDNVMYVLKRPDLTSFSPLKFFVLRGDQTLYGYMPLPVKTAQRQ